MDYTTLSDEAITAGLRACAEMAANPSSKELFEWVLAQRTALETEEARRALPARTREPDNCDCGQPQGHDGYCLYNSWQRGDQTDLKMADATDAGEA